MADPVISVIVPVYKAEKFLNKCIKSILSQSYRSLDIILVDDGSPDRCPQICDKFALKDSRIRVIHKENGGVSSARNMGIKAAFGEYICFVDADDWLPSNSMETLLQYAGKDIDLVCAAHTMVGIFGKSGSSDIENPKIDVCNMREFYNFVFSMWTGVWAKLYRTSIIRSNKLEFDIDVALGEDEIFNYRYLQCCKLIASTSKSLYYYNRIIGDSASIKGYLKYNLWLSTLVTEYKKVFGVQDNDICKEAIAEKSWGYFDRACANHFRLGDSEICQQKMKESFKILEPVLSESELVDFGFNSKGYQRALRRKEKFSPFLRELDFSGLYNDIAANNSNNTCTFKARLRSFYCRFVSKFLF